MGARVAFVLVLERGLESKRFVEKVRLFMQRLRFHAALPVRARTISGSILEESVGLMNLGAAA